MRVIKNEATILLHLNISKTKRQKETIVFVSHGKEFPNFKAEYRNLEKQIKSDFIDKMVFSNENIMKLLNSLNYQNESETRNINPFKRTSR